MDVIANETRLPIKLWTGGGIEASAFHQIKNIANLPFAFKHIAVMPDCHTGYGMPIGGVMATKGVVVPNAVGVDIGCGMSAVKTNIKELDVHHLKKIMGEIREVIPVGFNHNKELCSVHEMPSIDDLRTNHVYGSVVLNQFDSARKQLGTLGGGNHFIEIQKDTKGFIWIMIHSGSRNIGHKVASHYNKEAVKLNAKYFSSITKDQELAFLPIDDPLGKMYMKEMQYCVEFAKANRDTMMSVVGDIFWASLQDIKFEDVINIAHNYAAWENHFKQNVIVHRKGATRAYEGEIGIIPGSQGSKSYIVEGLGNEMSFKSCSHGAGRTMGRGQARKTLNLKEEIKRLDDQGIIHSIRNVSDLDEATGAYKNIEMVMENQKDLVKIVETLTPLAVIKG